MKVVLSLVSLLALSGAVFAQDRADIEATKIIGNRELPKVLYIVPWKKPIPTELSGKPPASVLDEALAPLDRDVFRRQVRYDNLVVQQQQQQASVSSSPSPAPAAKP